MSPPPFSPAPPPGPGWALSTTDLRKEYGGAPAVDGVDLQVPRGEVFALLGPNGAGKTTTIEILEGLRRRTSGEAWVLGVDPEHGDRRWRSRVGVVAQSTSAFDELTVGETVRHYATFYPSPRPVAEVLDSVDLAGRTGVMGLALSGGQKRRLDIALGIIGDPELVFLDEPTTGLDPAARRAMWDLVRQLAARGRTVILTTHYLDEAEVLADRVGIIIRGRIVELGAPADVGGRSASDAVISFAAEGVLGIRPLPTLPPGVRVERRADDARARVRITTGEVTAALRQLFGWAAALGVDDLPGLTVSRPTLEDVYLRLIAEHSPAAAGLAEPVAA